MLDRLDAMHSDVIQRQLDMQSQVGSMQSQVGEVMNRLERLETSPTPEFAAGQDSNPDCSVGAAVGAHPVAATFRSRHGLVNVDEDPGMLRRSARLLHKPRV